MKLKSVYSSVPVLIIGILVIYLLFLSRCGGIIEIYSSIFLGLILAIYLIIHTLSNIVRYFYDKTKINYKPLLITLSFIGVIYLIIYFEENKTEEKIVLQASNNEAYGTVDLKLLENNKLEFIYGHIEEKCRCEGSYLLSGDTLKIIALKKTKRLISFEEYLITDSHIIPIIDNTLAQDSTKFLERFNTGNLR